MFICLMLEIFFSKLIKVYFRAELLIGKLQHKILLIFDLDTWFVENVCRASVGDFFKLPYSDFKLFESFDL